MEAEALLRSYLKQRGIAEVSAVTYLGNFRRMVSEGFRDEIFPIPLDARQKLQEFLYRMVENGYAPVTVRNYLTTAHYFFEAVGHPEVSKNLKVPVKVQKKLTLALLPEEVDRLFKTLNADSKSVAQAFRVILLTGIRLSELVSIQCTKEELNAQRITIKSPNGFKRPVFLGTQAAALIQSLLRPKRKIPRGESGRSQLAKHLREAADKAQLEDITPSRIRMTYAVRMLFAGYDFEFVAKNLGFDRTSNESRRRLRDVLTDYVERLHEAEHGQ